ncbi:MAG TPA: T9SS type A sorting domain-containing protein [Bacteroidales bacterium]|nr:T9SS type A sorting domain-containing protein [Bacteroidales bacterium]
MKAQLTRPGSPIPASSSELSELQVISIPVSTALVKEAMQSRDTSYLKMASSGLLIDLDYSPENSGTWDTLNDGMKIWRIAFHVEGAAVLNLIFTPWTIEKGVKVFTSDRNREQIHGAYTDLNNKRINMLATSEITGDVIVVEMQVPVWCKNYGSFGISGMGCDFKRSNSLTTEKDGWYGWAGLCNVDINCTSNALVQKLKNSVVRIVYKGHERCTGVLINNTGQDGVNYVLTAGHCLTKEENANTAVFYFQYESPYCNGPDGYTGKSISGATIRARSSKVDFALVELLEPIPLSFHPYYAGWDKTGNIPQSGITIHHPLGDVKKVSAEENPLVKSTFGGQYDPDKHWMIRHWESGTTEPGSSGAPFFDQSGRIRGTLTGGLATCESPVEDYFEMFSHDWIDYPAPENQLAVWLDPQNTQPSILDGYDPYSDFWATGDTLNHISKDETLVSAPSGRDLTQFAEQFSESESKMISGLILDVAKSYAAAEDRYIKVKIWSGGDKPGNVVYEQTVFLADLSGEGRNFISFDSVVSAGKSFFAGYELFPDEPADTFATYMVNDRPSGQNTAFVYDGISWLTMTGYTSVNSSFAIFPVVFNSGAIPAENLQDPDIIVYPNPATSFLRIQFSHITTAPVTISLYNFQGQLVYEKEFQAYQHIIPVSLKPLSDGAYIVKILQENKTSFLKVSIVK